MTGMLRPSLLPSRVFLLPLLAVTLGACARPGIEGLQTYAYAGGQQQEGRIAYAQTPPAGGAYSPMWQKCAHYTAPVYDEYAVHSLERGALWITYRPDLSAADLQALQALLARSTAPGDPEVRPLAVLLSPVRGLGTPLVATVWNAQLPLAGVNDARLKAFLDGRDRWPAAPEAALGCASGVTMTQ